jgi:hypothetical protein
MTRAIDDKIVCPIKSRRSAACATAGRMRRTGMIPMDSDSTRDPSDADLTGDAAPEQWPARRAR